QHRRARRPELADSGNVTGWREPAHVTLSDLTATGSLSLPGDVLGRSRYLVARLPARLHRCGEGATGGGGARPAPAAAAGGLAGLCGRPRLFGPAARAGLRRRDPRLRHYRPLPDRSPAG